MSTWRPAAHLYVHTLYVVIMSRQIQQFQRVCIFARRFANPVKPRIMQPPRQAALQISPVRPFKHLTRKRMATNKNKIRAKLMVPKDSGGEAAFPPYLLDAFEPSNNLTQKCIISAYNFK